MEQEKLPVGYSMALVQNEDLTTSYIGFTKEQKREMLTHALIARSGEAIAPVTADSTAKTNEEPTQDRRE